MSYATPKLGAMLVAAAMLAACGGGGGDSATGTAANASQENASVQAASFADCLILTPGTKFTYFYNGGISYPFTQEVVYEMFNGQMAYGIRSDDGLETSTSYQTVDDTYLTLLGYQESATTKTMADYRIPVNMTPGQSITIAHTDTFTFPPLPPATTPTSFVEHQTDTVTFVGFEDLTMAGKTFQNTCKISFQSSLYPGETRYSWLTKGIGTIRQEVRDTQGDLIPNRDGGLLSIITSP